MEMHPMAEHEWDAFAGAEGWPDAAPLFGEGAFADGMAYVLVLDKNGGCLVADDEQARYGGYALGREFATPEDAREFAMSLGAPQTKEEFFQVGFEQP